MSTPQTNRWIDLPGGLGSCLTLLLLCGQLAASQAPYGRWYDPQRDPFADGRAALALAADSGRRVLIEVGGDWCSWCHVLERTIQGDPGLRAMLDRHYVVLKVNVSDDNDNADFLRGLPAFDGYPHIFVAAADGNVLHSQDVSRWLVGGRYSEQRIRAFLVRWQPPSTTPDSDGSGSANGV